MKKKKAFLDSNLGFALKNICAAVLLVFVLLTTLVIYLRRYTQHGVEIDVPNVVGLYSAEAQAVLSAADLQYTIIDSTYTKKVPLGTIVDQNPVAGSHAKAGRVVYTVINASCRRQIPLPNLHDVSQRQAELTLRSLGIEVDNIEYEPSEFKNLVLGIRRGDALLEPGTMLAEGSTVTLIVGRGQGDELVAVPFLQGKTLIEARSLILSSYLTVGRVQYDEALTEENRDLFVIYSQEPSAGSSVQEGSRVDIRLSTNIEKAVTEDNTESEDDFF